MALCCCYYFKQAQLKLKTVTAKGVGENKQKQ